MDAMVGEIYGVTGRDDFLIARALAIGVLTLDRAPLECRCGHDRDQLFEIMTRLEPDPARREAFFAYARSVIAPRRAVGGAPSTRRG